MAEVVTTPPWPCAAMVLDLDRLGVLSPADLARLESRTTVSVAAVAGRCEGRALAAALATDLLFSGPEATFGHPGSWTDVVIRRGVGVAGRRVMAYLAMTPRTIDAELARRWGIVSEVAERPVEAALALADAISLRSPTAVATILRQCHRGAGRDYIDTLLTGGTPDGGTGT